MNCNRGSCLNSATHYVEVIYGRNIKGDRMSTETDYAYGYFCDHHVPEYSEILPDNEPGWIPAECWEVLEGKTEELP